MNQPADPLTDYYARRAREYERIYHRDDPVRQGEQQAIARAMREAFSGRRVLELACGTGYWTAHIADIAERVVAVDAVPEVLEIARAKGLPADRVAFRRGDCYRPADVPGAFDAGLANFWLSHVPRVRLSAFLAGFHARLGPGAVVFMADNVYVPGGGGDLVRRPGCNDTYKRRTLDDGATHEVLKNYYAEPDLRALLAPHAADLAVHMGRCFWWVTYVVAT